MLLFLYFRENEIYDDIDNMGGMGVQRFLIYSHYVIVCIQSLCISYKSYSLHLEQPHINLMLTWYF